MSDLNNEGKYTLKEILDKIKQTFCSYSIHTDEVESIIKNISKIQYCVRSSYCSSNWRIREKFVKI